MTPDQLANLRALAEAATRGKWPMVTIPCANGCCGGGPVHALDEHGATLAIKDARYIAAVSPDVVLGMLDQIDAASNRAYRDRALVVDDFEEALGLVDGVEEGVRLGRVTVPLLGGLVQPADGVDGHAHGRLRARLRVREQARRVAVALLAAPDAIPHEADKLIATIKDIESERDIRGALLARVCNAFGEPHMMWHEAVGRVEQERKSIADVLLAVAEGGWASGEGSGDPRFEGPKLKDAAELIREHYRFRETVWNDDAEKEAVLDEACAKMEAERDELAAEVAALTHGTGEGAINEHWTCTSWGNFTRTLPNGAELRASPSGWATYSPDGLLKDHNDIAIEKATQRLPRVNMRAAEAAARSRGWL